MRPSASNGQHESVNNHAKREAHRYLERPFVPTPEGTDRALQYTRQARRNLYNAGEIARSAREMANESFSEKRVRYLERLRHRIVDATGLPEIYWASIYLPVLAHEAGFDADGNSVPVPGNVIFDRSALCDKLEIDPCLDVGRQLFKQKRLTFEEAWLVDSDLFVGRIIDLELRFDRAVVKVEDVEKLLSQLQLQGAIEYFEEGHTHDGYLFEGLVTANFKQLCSGLANALPDLATIVSLDGCELVENGRTYD